MKYCEHCGQENSSSSNFCQACGKKMSTNNNSKQKKERQPQKKGSKKVLYSILAFLVIILAGAGYIFKDTLFYSKDTFMKEYNSAVDNANSGNFSEAKNILNQIKDKDKYDDVNVEEDIRIVADLSTIDKLLQNENATELNTKVTEFKKDYKTSTSRFIESGNSLITDANTYKKYSDGLTEFNQYLAFDKWEVIRDNGDITLKKLDKIIIENQEKKIEIFENEFLNTKFDISVEKIGLESYITKILSNRIVEIERNITIGNSISSIILIGSVMEGILLGMAQKHP